ncbi:hypothetical protein ACFX1Z_024742 [Malus domestica]
MGSLWRSISNNSKSTQVPAAASSTLLKTIVNVKSGTAGTSNHTSLQLQPVRVPVIILDMPTNCENVPL